MHSRNSSVERGARVFQKEKYDSEQVDLIVEEPLELRVDGEPIGVLMRTPGSEAELAVGFCLTSGVLSEADEIASVVFSPEGSGEARNTVNVYTVKGRGEGGTLSRAALLAQKAMPARSGRGLGGMELMEHLCRDLRPHKGGVRIDLGRIVELQYLMAEKQSLSHRTSGAHAAALARSNGEVVAIREDVGSHNALDKAVGHALSKGVDLRGCFLLLSSRVSYELIQKAAKAGIPVIATLWTATSLAADLAHLVDCTLVGRLRGEEAVVYTHPERIIPPASLLRH